MGRRLQIPFEAPPPPFLAGLLLVAWAAASVAVMLSLCATCLRKGTSRKQPSPSPSSLSAAKLGKEAAGGGGGGGGAVAAQSLAMAEQEGEKFAEEAAAMTVIELAPDVATHGPIGPTVLLPSPSTTKRRLSMSLSKGLPDKLRGSWRERKGGGGDSDDTIWKKTIILGEKCRVADEEEEEEVIVVDEKGNRQRYHPQRSRQTSRNSSFAYAD